MSEAIEAKTESTAIDYKAVLIKLHNTTVGTLIDAASLIDAFGSAHCPQCEGKLCESSESGECEAHKEARNIANGAIGRFGEAVEVLNAVAELLSNWPGVSDTVH